MRKNEAFPREMGENRKDQEKNGEMWALHSEGQKCNHEHAFQSFHFLGQSLIMLSLPHGIVCRYYFYMSPLILNSYYADVSRFFNENDPVGFLWLPFL